MSPAQRFVLFLAITPLVFAQDKIENNPLAGKCPPLWHLWGDSCYRFTKYKSWADAKEACRQMGGDMAAPRSQEENDFIGGFAEQLSFDEYVWIDCHDQQEEGRWFCAGRRAAGETFSNWRSEEPNSDRGDYCAAMNIMYNGLWKDVPCEYKQFPAICKTVQCASPCLYCFTTNTEGRLENNLFDE